MAEEIEMTPSLQTLHVKVKFGENTDRLTGTSSFASTNNTFKNHIEKQTISLLMADPPDSRVSEQQHLSNNKISRTRSSNNSNSRSNMPRAATAATLLTLLLPSTLAIMLSAVTDDLTNLTSASNQAAEILNASLNDTSAMVGFEVVSHWLAGPR